MNNIQKLLQRLQDICRRCQLNWHKFPIGAIPAIVAEGAIARALKISSFDNPYSTEGQARIIPLQRPNIGENKDMVSLSLLDETEYNFMDRAAESSWVYGWVHSATILEL